MKVMVTGATGFLGKFVLSELLANPRVTEVHAVCRSKTSHPDPRVTIHRCDLTLPGLVLRLPVHKMDVIIHLSGLYDFAASYAPNYLANVIATSNLIDAIKTRGADTPVVMASTFALGEIADGPQISTKAEQRLTKLPSKAIPYIYTKAIAEEALLQSDLPASIMRLGIIVGDSISGHIERIDGPYYVLDAIRRLKERPVVGRLMSLIPKTGVMVFPAVGDPEAHMPLIPVDYAAKAMVAACLAQCQQPQTQLFGVYHPEAAKVGTLYREFLSRYFGDCRLKFVKDPPPLQFKSLFGIPLDAFSFALYPRVVCSDNFVRHFPEIKIPETSVYFEALMAGYHGFVGGLSHVA